MRKTTTWQWRHSISDLAVNMIWLVTYRGDCVLWYIERLQCDILSRSTTYSKLVNSLADAASHCFTQLPQQVVGMLLNLQCAVYPISCLQPVSLCNIGGWKNPSYISMVLQLAAHLHWVTSFFGLVFCWDQTSD